MPNYTEISLDSAESQRTERGENYHGETYDPRTGAAVAHLPGETVPCPGIAKSNGSHAKECACLGSGMVALRRPLAAEILPVDDGLDALELALADNAAEIEERVDPLWGCVGGAAEIMQRKVAGGGGGSGRGGGRKQRKKTLKRGAFGERASRHWSDSRPEMSGKGVNLTETAAAQADEEAKVQSKAGRKPRFAIRRPLRVNLTLAPTTIATIIAHKSDLAAEFYYALA